MLSEASRAVTVTLTDSPVVTAVGVTAMLKWIGITLTVTVPMNALFVVSVAVNVWVPGVPK